MIKHKLVSIAAAAALLASVAAAGAQTTKAMNPMTESAGAMAPSEHGMPAGGDGIVYTGKPDLDATISFVTAGGGPSTFSTVKALTALAGAQTANAEVAKLTKQYGKDAATSFITVSDFAVADAAKRAAAAGVKFPEPTLSGKELATRLVSLGAGNGTFYVGTMLDHMLTHGIHEQVMADIDGKFGFKADANYHRVANQAFADLAHALGATDVKVAAYH
jgi:hypothetical protein